MWDSLIYLRRYGASTQIEKPPSVYQRQIQWHSQTPQISNSVLFGMPDSSETVVSPQRARLHAKSLDEIVISDPVNSYMGPTAGGDLIETMKLRRSLYWVSACVKFLIEIFCRRHSRTFK